MSASAGDEHAQLIDNNRLPVASALSQIHSSISQPELQLSRHGVTREWRMTHRADEPHSMDDSNGY